MNKMKSKKIKDINNCMIIGLEVADCGDRIVTFEEGNLIHF